MLDNSEDHLLIENIKPEDRGNYLCIGKNKFGTAKMNFSVKVYESAQILFAKEDVTRKEYQESARLSCFVKGNPLPTVHWIFNGHALSSTTKIDMGKIAKRSNESTIYFTRLKDEISYLGPLELNSTNEKYYSELTKIDSEHIKLDIVFKNKRDILHMRKFECYTFNDRGSDKKSVDIVLKYKPFINEKKRPMQTEVQIFEGMPLILNCPVEGHPKPNISWFKDGKFVSENDQIKLQESGKILNIPETINHDQGNYSCLAKNDQGQVELTFTVLILSPPKFKDAAKSIFSQFSSIELDYGEVINASKGNDITLECPIEASPAPKIFWVKLNQSTGDKIYKETSTSLVRISKLILLTKGLLNNFFL